MSNIDVTESEFKIDAILKQMINNLEGGVMVTTTTTLFYL